MKCKLLFTFECFLSSFLEQGQHEGSVATFDFYIDRLRAYTTVNIVFPFYFSHISDYRSGQKSAEMQATAF